LVADFLGHPFVFVPEFSRIVKMRSRDMHRLARCVTARLPPSALRGLLRIQYDTVIACERASAFFLLDQYMGPGYAVHNIGTVENLAPKDVLILQRYEGAGSMLVSVMSGPFVRCELMDSVCVAAAAMAEGDYEVPVANAIFARDSCKLVIVLRILDRRYSVLGRA
jgi:hypothetical protein